MKIYIKCCDAVNPVGVIVPTFTWKVTECHGLMQRAYEIWIYGEEYSWHSGKVESDQSVRVCCDCSKLESNRKYYWKVKIYTNQGELESEAGWFITGLIDEADLKWITADSAISSPLLRKEFKLDAVPEYAVANVCGLGFFELYINGKKVSDDIMQPVRSDYDEVTYRNIHNAYDGSTRKSVYYLSYEVSRYLTQGRNTIVLWLGNGWYREKARATIRGDFDYGNQLKAFLRLSAGNVLIETDETWQYCESPIVHNNFFSGEIYDATKENPDFFESGYECSNYAAAVSAPKAKLISQLCPGERVIESVKAKRIKADIYDVGEVVSGFVKLRLKGLRGERVEIFYAEDFDGEKLDYTSTVGYVEDDINQIQKDVYILDDSEVQTYTPRFVWHTYRYIYIRYTENVEILGVDSLFVCTDMPKRARFKCSDDNINAIYKMYQNTALSNMHGCTPLDCPHRERLPYTGDGQLSANAAMYNFDAYQAYRKWIADINDSQSTETGFVPYTAPFSGGCGGHAWGSAVVTVPWHFYLQYGDKDFLKESVSHIERWILYLKEHKDEDGLISRHVEGSWSLGDWVMPSEYQWSDPKPEAIKIPPELVNTVYYVYCIKLFIKMCAELSIEVQPWLDIEMKESLGALADKYVYNSGVFDEQEADAYLLFANVVTGEKANEVLSSLIEKIKNRGYTFNSGMVGTELLFKVLDGADRNDVALNMLMATEYPSIGYMLKNGATTLWETWEGTGARSHNAFSSIGAWYIYGLAGIKPDGGYKTFTLKPCFAENLSYVDVSLDSEYGEIGVCWNRVDKKICLDVKVPFNTTAKLITDGKPVELKCGEYRYEID
ncbi:MAG: family 78 glycoside hydrolase catalytic domain [Clostridia bacterium]|nr:family 78 glycoside hydrolase catalytic domain [Clostridia bacterium]